jgi:hypothetical protein
MKIKNIVNIGILSGTFFSMAASAAFCDENVVTLISHSNGNIYFTTDKTCQYWCQVSGNPSFLKQTYAMMMAAQMNNKKLGFSWNELTTCDEKNKVYAIPDFVVAAPL